MITSEGAVTNHNCSSTVTEYNYNFKIIDSSHLVVKWIDTDGVEHTLVEETDYTVSGVGNDSGGHITLTTAKDDGTLSLYRDVPITQETDIRPRSNYPANVLENIADKQVMISQLLNEKIERALRLPLSDEGDMELPAKDARKNTYLYFDSDGNVEPYPGAPPKFWIQEHEYSSGEIVQHGGALWKSKVDANVGHEPTAGAYWRKIPDSEKYDPDVEYDMYDITSYEGTLVKSKVNGNYGNVPDTSPGATDAYWEVVETGGGVETEGELGEAADQNDALYFSTDGKLYKGDKRDLSKCFIAGLAVVSGNAGDTIKIAKAGRLSGFSGLTAGTQYYLGDDGDLVTSGDIDYFDYKVPLGVAVSATELEVRVGNPEYRANTDDGLPIGHIVYSINPSAPAGYLPFAYNNAVSIAQYPVLYSVVGKKFEKMHTDAGDPSTDSDHFYPTPIPGYFPRPAIPDTEEIDSTSDINTSNDTITLSADDYNTLRRSRDATAANPHGVPVLLRLESGSLPAGLSEDTVYYVRFTDDSNHYIKLYTTEENAITDTSAVDITGTDTGKFKLTQAGIYQRDAFQGFGLSLRVRTPSTGGATAYVAFSTNSTETKTVNGHISFLSDGSNGTPRTSNETRPNEVFLYGYIKAEYITPAGEPVSALRHDTGWVSNSDWTNADITINHNLNADLHELFIQILFSSDGTSTNAVLPILTYNSDGSGSIQTAGLSISCIDNNNIKLETGYSGVTILKNDGSLLNLDTETYYYRIVVFKPALLATYTDAPIRAKYEITDSNDVTVSLPDANGQTAERTYWRTGSGSGKVKFITYGSQTINGDSASTWYLEGEGVIKLAPVDGNWEVVEFSDRKDYPDDGDWKNNVVRRYIDGKMEETGEYSPSSLDITSAWDDNYTNGYGADHSFPKAFTTIEYANVFKVEGNGTVWISNDGNILNYNRINFVVTRPTSITLSNPKFKWYAVGTWK